MEHQTIGEKIENAFWATLDAIQAIVIIGAIALILCPAFLAL